MHAIPLPANACEYKSSCLDLDDQRDVQILGSDFKCTPHHCLRISVDARVEIVMIWDDQRNVQILGSDFLRTHHHCLRISVDMREEIVMIWMFSAMCRSWGLTSNAHLTIACVSVLI